MKKLFLLPDCHFPYCDLRAFRTAIKAAKFFKPDVLVVLGDFADFYAVSAHNRNPARKTRLVEEQPQILEGLDYLDDLGVKEKFFLEGNHENRLQRYLWTNAPALEGLAGMKVENILELPQRGWKFYPYRKHLRIGKLHLTHDAGYAGQGAVNQTGSAFQSNVVFGHTHRLSVNYSGNVLGKNHVSASLGWLGAKEAASEYEYDAKIDRNWQHGFGTAYLEDSGKVHLSAVPIVDYSCVVEGKQISVSR